MRRIILFIILFLSCGRDDIDIRLSIDSIKRWSFDGRRIYIYPSPSMSRRCLIVDINEKGIKFDTIIYKGERTDYCFILDHRPVEIHSSPYDIDVKVYNNTVYILSTQGDFILTEYHSVNGERRGIIKNNGKIYTTFYIDRMSNIYLAKTEDYGVDIYNKEGKLIKNINFKKDMKNWGIDTLNHGMFLRGGIHSLVKIDSLLILSGFYYENPPGMGESKNSRTFIEIYNMKLNKIIKSKTFKLPTFMLGIYKNHILFLEISKLTMESKEVRIWSSDLSHL